MVDFARSSRPHSVAERLATLPRDERLKVLTSMDEEAMLDFAFDWRIWARPEQLPPAGDWNHWGIVWGRGAGKTRSAAEFIHDEADSKDHEFIHLVGRSAGDVRKTMVEGESGLLATAHPDRYPKYEPSKKKLTWPNGVVALLFNATEANELRGPQCSCYWADEVASWQNAYETWDNLMFGFRLGVHPRGVFTTTPRPIKLVRDLMSGTYPGVVLAKPSSTYDNYANLAATFIAEVISKYKGTRKGRQELFGELLLDVPGALWTLALIENQRVLKMPEPDKISRIVVAIDPAVTTGEDANETGIIVAAKDRRRPAHFYVMRDLSGHWHSTQWSQKAVAAFHSMGADRIVGEVNNGGDLIESTIRVVDPNVSYKKVHASRGKYVRGEPVAALYEQGRVHHVGSFDSLEDQMITFVPDNERTPGDSPDRADALVWAITELAEMVHIPKAAPASTSSYNV